MRRTTKTENKDLNITKTIDMKVRFFRMKGFELLPFIGYYTETKVIAWGWLIWYWNVTLKQ